MIYTFTFSTIEDYLASKVSNASDSIKSVLADTTHGLTRSAISTITGTGQTFIDAVNIIVEEKYGDIGDILLRKTVTINNTSVEKLFWLKSNAQWSQYSGAFGSTTASCSAFATSGNHFTSAGYTVVGFVINRVKNEGLIMSNTIGGIPWCRTESYNTSIEPAQQESKWKIQFTNMPNINKARTRKSINRTTAYASLGLDMRERLSAAYNQYSNPFPRSAWNAMMAAYQAGTATAGNASGGSTYDTTDNWTWKTEKVAAGGSLTGNTIKATFNFKTSAGVQSTGLNPADWDFKFDRWYKDCMEIYNVAPNSAAYADSIGNELSGREQTRRMIEFITTYNADSSHTDKIQATASGNCAYACDLYSVISTSHALFGQHKWWLPNLTELTYATTKDKILYRKGIDLSGTYLWSSTQYSVGIAFLVSSDSSNCMSNNYYKYNTLNVRAVCAYQFPNS